MGIKILAEMYKKGGFGLNKLDNQRDLILNKVLNQQPLSDYQFDNGTGKTVKKSDRKRTSTDVLADFLILCEIKDVSKLEQEAANILCCAYSKPRSINKKDVARGGKHHNDSIACG